MFNKHSRQANKVYKCQVSPHQHPTSTNVFKLALETHEYIETSPTSIEGDA